MLFFESSASREKRRIYITIFSITFLCHEEKIRKNETLYEVSIYLYYFKEKVRKGEYIGNDDIEKIGYSEK